MSKINDKGLPFAQMKYHLTDDDIECIVAILGYRCVTRIKDQLRYVLKNKAQSIHYDIINLSFSNSGWKFEHFVNRNKELEIARLILLLYAEND